VRVVDLLRRRPWLTFVIAAAVALVVLIVSALRPGTGRTFALEVENAEPVATIRAGTQACEGPITSPSSFKEVGIWGGPPKGSAVMSVLVRNAHTDRIIGHGTIIATTTSQHRARLGAPVGAGTPARICVLGRGGEFTLLGSIPSDRSVHASGTTPGLQFSLVLLHPGQGLLSSLPTAFARAALFKLSWIGSWTFWLLLGALLATIPLGALAIALVAREDRD
jgi:hypothetical protein